MDTKTDKDSPTEFRPAKHDISVLRPQLHRPRYTFQELKQIDSKLSYGKLNSWESHGFISPNRKKNNAGKKNAGWRKFSFSEAVLLLMISDWMHLGLARPIICHVLNQLSSPPLGLLSLEVYIVSSIRGAWYVLLIDGTGRTTIPFNSQGLLNAIAPDKNRGPMVISPLSDYVRKMLSLSQTEVVFTNPFECRKLDPDHDKLLSIIADQNYEKIEITKSNGKVKIAKALSRKKGMLGMDDVIFAVEAGDYREVTVSKNDGKIVTITTTDKYRM